MSLLGRLQDMFGLSDEYAPFEDDPDYVHEQALDPSYADRKGHRKSNDPPNNVIEMPGLNSLQSELIVMEPRMFEEIPEAILALRERKTVILNLANMDPDQAQRSVDYVAGGVFAIDGHQERIGSNVFLFTPNSVQINTYAANPGGLPSPSPGFRNPFTSVAPAPQSLSDRLNVRTNQPPAPPPAAQQF
jgi:cell division inhibitor SepF